jgi:hypothetical protein
MIKNPKPNTILTKTFCCAAQSIYQCTTYDFVTTTYIFMILVFEKIYETMIVEKDNLVFPIVLFPILLFIFYPSTITGVIR